MGCSKNLVDSERLARRFLDAGIEIDFDSAEGADYAVIKRLQPSDTFTYV